MLGESALQLCCNLCSRFFAATFTVLCYNVLCDKYATTNLYSYCPQWALNWEYRKSYIVKDILTYDADIVTLQVCRRRTFTSYKKFCHQTDDWHINFHHAYKQIYVRLSFRKWRRSNSGCCSSRNWPRLVIRESSTRSHGQRRWTRRNENMWMVVRSFGNMTSLYYMNLSVDCSFFWIESVLETD